MSSQNTEIIIKEYFLNTSKAISTLIEKELYGHALVLMYSTIDTCGLLDAPPQQSTSTGDSFKKWVVKYVLKDPSLEFNEIDLWGARCSMLHTFTSESNLSKEGKARELIYFKSDNANSIETQKIRSFSNQATNHLAVDYSVLLDSFMKGLRCFVPDLDRECKSSPDHLERLRKLLMTYNMNEGS